MPPSERILAIDPGTDKSAWIDYSADRVHAMGLEPNDSLLGTLWGYPGSGTLVVEMIASYGMPVGAEVFETCVWIGRFQEAWLNGHDEYLNTGFDTLFRATVKMHLCKTMRATDANIRQALLDRFPRTGGGATPQVGVKSQPGPLYGVKKDIWSALAVAVTYTDGVRDG